MRYGEDGGIHVTADEKYLYHKSDKEWVANIECMHCGHEYRIIAKGRIDPAAQFHTDCLNCLKYKLQYVTKVERYGRHD